MRHSIWGRCTWYTANDKGMAKTTELFGMIREYAKIHGRRHKILLDAHTHRVNIRGKLLFDYHAMPFTRMPLWKCREKSWYWCARATAKVERIKMDGPRKLCHT